MAAGSPARGNTFHTHAAPLCGTWRVEAGAHHPVRDAFQPGAGGEPGAQGGVPISQTEHVTEALAT